MCVFDLRPFNITHGKGFEEFSRQIFDAGKYFGKMFDVKELLPRRTTVRNAIRINLFYHSSCRYFILDKPRYRHCILQRKITWFLSHHNVICYNCRLLDRAV